MLLVLQTPPHTILAATLGTQFSEIPERAQWSMLITNKRVQTAIEPQLLEHRCLVYHG